MRAITPEHKQTATFTLGFEMQASKTNSFRGYRVNNAMLKVNLSE